MKKESIKQFSEYLESKGFIAHTIRKYTQRVNQFNEWASENYYAEIHYPELMQYIRHLQSKGENTVLINAKLRAIRHYFDYENQTGNHALNPIKGYNPATDLQLKGTKYSILHDCLPKQELENLYENYLGREKVMLGLMVYQGLKAAELERVETLHINFHKGTIYVPGSKKSNARLLKLEAVQLYEMIQLTAARKEMYLLGNDLKNRLHALFKQLKKQYPKIRNAHQLRGSLIMHWIQTEGLRQAQYKAGHTTVAGTEKYKQIDLKDLQQRINEHHPLK